MGIVRKYKSLITIISIILIIGLFYTFFIQVKYISSGHIGVKATKINLINNNKEYSVYAIKGYTVFMPLLTELTIYPTTIQTATYPSGIKITASDGSEFIANPSISYQLEEAKVVDFFKLIKKNPKEFNDEYLKDLVYNSFASVASKYSTDSLIRNICNFDLEVNTILAAKMKELGLTLKTSNSFLSMPDSIKRMIELRAISVQNTLLAKEQIKEVFAKANLQRLEDSLRYSVLTPLAIKKLFIDKWDGKLPSNVEALKAYKDITE